MASDDSSTPSGSEDTRSAAGQKPIPSNHSLPTRVILLGVLVASSMALAGGTLVAYGSQTAWYGVTLFIALPFATGFITACFARTGPALVLSMALSIVVCFLVLLATGLEGIVCICMAAPLILAGAGAGALVGTGMGWLVRRVTKAPTNLAILPVTGALGLFGVGTVEDRFAGPDRMETVVSSVVVEGTLEETWDQILAREDISASRPLLLRLGLPVPQRCTLEGSGVGATRTCHFDSGVIEERVTTWEPPHRLDVRIVRSTLPGRHWLGFVSALYEMEEESPGRVRITRSTTISSKLRPGAYWRHFERMGVEAEHRYLFDGLANSRE